MNVDDIARRARRDTPPPDLHASLVAFRRRVRRHHYRQAAVASMAVIVVVAGGAQWLRGGAEDTSRPVDRHASSVPSPRSDGVGCDNHRVSCLGDGRYTTYLDVDLTWRLPVGFDAPYSGAGPTAALVESNLHDGRAGVSVLQHATAAAPVASPSPVSSITTAQAFTDWVSRRPFLSASNPRRSMVGGRPAWTVDVQVSSQVPDGPAVCGRRQSCYPIVYQRDGVMERVSGLRAGMTGRYTAMEFAEAGIVVIWSWSLTGDIPAAVAEVVDSIRFD